MDNSDSSDSKKRLFIAIPVHPPETTLQSIFRCRSLLKHIPVRWVIPENYHLTLAFLGDTDSFYLNAMNLGLREIAAKQSPFSLDWHQTGFFQSAGTPRVIWIAPSPQEALTGLRSDVSIFLKELGVLPSPGRFSAHLTLGRIPHSRRAEKRELQDALTNIVGFRHQVNSFVLMESTLTPQGAVYTELEKFGLKG